VFAKLYVPPVATELSNKSKSSIASKSATPSIVSSEPRTRPLRLLLKKQPTFAPLKGVPSVSSLSVKTVNFGNISGCVEIFFIDAALALIRPPSSLKAKK